MTGTILLGGVFYDAGKEAVEPGIGSCNVTVNKSGLSAGTYTDTITISAAGATNTPQVVPVTLTVSGANFLSGWSYRKLLTVTGSTDGAKTNYQVKLNVYKGTGTDAGSNVYLNNHCSDNFTDIRFTKSDGTSLQDYWIESYTAGASAVVWVELDSLPASPGTAAFYCYYGNSNAANVSNGTNTFIKFDNFEWGTDATALSTSGGGLAWTITAPGSSKVEIDTGQYAGGTRSARFYRDGTNNPVAYHAQTAANTYAIRLKLRKENTSELRIAHGNGSYNIYLSYEYGNNNIQYYNGSTYTAIGSLPQDTWGLLEIRNINFTAHTYDVYLNDALLQSGIAMETSSTWCNSVVDFVVANVTAQSWIDNYMVRNYTAHEPTLTSWSSEQYASANTGNEGSPVLAQGDSNSAGDAIQKYRTAKEMSSSLNGSKPALYDPAPGTSTFVYDGNGSRVKKTEGGQTILYINQYYEKNLTTGEITTYYYSGARG